MDTISTILFLGAAQGIILAVVLLTLRRGNRIANRILAIILMLFSINIMLHTLAHTKFLFHIPHHSGIIAILFLPFGPLFYFYVNAHTFPLTSHPFRFGKKEFSHFLPFVCCAVLFVPFYIQTIHTEESTSIQKIISWLVIVHVLIYIFVVIKKLRSHSRKIKTSFSSISIEKISLNWLRFLITVVVILWLSIFFLEGSGKKTDLWNYIWVLISIFMYMIGYMGLRQPEIFSGPNNGNLIHNRVSKKKYGKSTLTPEKAKKYLQRLLHVMAVDKPFLDSNLTLPGLAQNLSISIHELSQIINEQLKKNFFEFVNSYRVEEAKKMMADPEYENINIAAIGFEAGFNSTSTFNAAFKKYTGMTPSQFSKISKKNDK